MKVIHLTSVHSRYDTRIFLKECRSLVAAGHVVTLVVADGKGDAEREDVRIIDVGRPAGRFERMVKTANHVADTALLLQADVYHMHDPELLRIAGRLRHATNMPRVIFDAHEDVPRQVLSKPWIPRMLRPGVSCIAEVVENRVAKSLSGIVAATPHIAARFSRVNSYTIDINNYPMPDELAPLPNRGARKRQICYVGGITRARGIESLVHALPLMPDVTLVLCGLFQQADIEANVRALPGWAQVDYRGQVDRVGVQSVVGESLAGIVTFLPAPNHIDAQPNKMFEYMSAELPVIASDFPLWRRIIDGAGAGICVDPQSPQAIASAIRTLLDDPDRVTAMGKAGRKAVLDAYNWPSEAAKLVQFYEGLA